MKLLDSFTIVWLTISINRSFSANIEQLRVRRSVFDIIATKGIKFENKINKPINQQTEFISTIIENEKPVTYEQLKQIFIQSKENRRQNRLKNRKSKIEMKIHFNENIKKQRKLQISKENIIVNFSFITKL